MHLSALQPAPNLPGSETNPIDVDNPRGRIRGARIGDGEKEIIYDLSVGHCLHLQRYVVV